MLSKGYTLFESSAHPYNLNIVGWRDQNYKLDAFNDIISVYWKEGDIWRFSFWPATTMPGKSWMFKPSNPKGAAILVPGQYHNVYEIGPFKSGTALKQVEPMSVYRDNNKDSEFNLNPATIDKGLFGIHIHCAGFFTKYVGLSSAGCQVFQKAMDFADFLTLCSKAASNWGNRFTYTLMEI